LWILGKRREENVCKKCAKILACRAHGWPVKSINDLHLARCLLSCKRLHLVNFANRHTRGWMFTATAILSLAVWLFVAAAEIYAPLHARLHGGTIPDNDNCAVVAITHGNVEPVASAAPVIIPAIWVEITPRIEFSVFRPSTVLLPDSRGPPVFSFNS
jgi:hypothetical protein